jgi:hypothetical protein
LELKTNNRFYRSDVLLDVKELIHAPNLKPIVFTLQFGVVAKAFKKDILLIGHLCLDCVLKELHHYNLVVMDRGVFCLIELIFQCGGDLDFFASFGVLKFSSPNCFSLDMLLNDLVS